MKLRIYPKTHVMKGLLTEKREKQLNAVDELRKELAALEASQGTIVTDPFGNKKQALSGRLELEQRILDEYTDRLVMLESHAPPEVTLEIEI